MTQRSNTADNNVEDAIVADILYSLHLSDAVNPVPMTKLSDIKAVQCGCDIEEDHLHHQKAKHSPIMEDSLRLTTDNKSDEENSIIGDESKSFSSSDDENERPHDLIEEQLVVGNSFKDQNPTPNSNGSDSMGVAARTKKTKIKRPKKKLPCECGAVILARSYWKHNKSRKHIDFCVWKQQRQESQQQEEPENIQTSTQHPTMPSEAILPQQKRQKIISSPLALPQEEQNTSYELVSSSPPSLTAIASSATHTTTAISSASHPNAYQLTNPPAITSYPSQQQLLHYNPYHQQPSLLPNQLVWVQHPLYPYPIVMMAPPSSSFSFAPQPQPQPLSWYYTANPFSSATEVTAENLPSSLPLPPDGK